MLHPIVAEASSTAVLMHSGTKAFVSGAKDAPAYWQLGNLWRVMATGVQTNNFFTLIDQVMSGRPNTGPITHAHEQTEGLFVLSGHLTINVGGQHGLKAGPGSFIHIPKNTEHSFVVDGHDTRLLNFYTPAGFEQILLGVSLPAKERVVPEETLVPSMLPPRWLADTLSRQYGTINVGGQPWCDKLDGVARNTHETKFPRVQPYLLNVSEVETIHTMGGEWNLLATSAATDGEYFLADVRYPHGQVFAVRTYDKLEIIFLLQGEMQLLLDDQVQTVVQDSMVVIPAGTVSSAKVVSDHARFLNFHLSSGFEDVLRFTRDALTGPNNRIDDRAQDLVNAALGRLLCKFGMRYIAVPSPFT